MVLIDNKGHCYFSCKYLDYTSAKHSSSTTVTPSRDAPRNGWVEEIINPSLLTLQPFQVSHHKYFPFIFCWNSCRVFGELLLDEEASTLFFASGAKCVQLSVKLFSHPFFYVTQLYKKYNIIREEKNWAGRMTVPVH